MSHLERISFTEVPGWRYGELAEALAAQKRSCAVLLADESAQYRRWLPFCAAVMALAEGDTQGYWHILETYLAPHKVSVDEQILFTGYYEPLLRGSRQANETYAHPLYGLPDVNVHYRLPRRYLTDVLQQQASASVNSRKKT